MFRERRTVFSSFVNLSANATLLSPSPSIPTFASICPFLLDRMLETVTPVGCFAFTKGGRHGCRSEEIIVTEVISWTGTCVFSEVHRIICPNKPDKLRGCIRFVKLKIVIRYICRWVDVPDEKAITRHFIIAATILPGVITQTPPIFNDKHLL